FENLWIPDEKFFRDPYCTMTVCSQVTSKIKIGIGITDPYTRRLPFTAASIATVNEISQGRAVLGIGAGGAGLKSLGLSRTNPVKTIRDAINILRALLRGESISWKSEAVSLSDARINFTSGTVPIYVGAYGPQTLQMAGEIADGVLLGSGAGASPTSIAYATENINLGAKKAGRNPESVQKVSWIHSVISDDLDEALRLIKPTIAISIWNSRAVIRGLPHGVWGDDVDQVIKIMETEYTTGHEAQDSKALTNLTKIISDDVASKLSVTGTPSDCLKKIKKIKETGIKQISVVFPGMDKDRKRSFELFSKQVLPELLQT
ncbi:MAG: LLM class flavin-dependent oxidoreductase, partial [Nitrososphaerales archaeon]